MLFILGSASGQVPATGKAWSAIIETTQCHFNLSNIHCAKELYKQTIRFGSDKPDYS